MANAIGHVSSQASRAMKVDTTCRFSKANANRQALSPTPVMMTLTCRILPLHPRLPKILPFCQLPYPAPESTPHLQMADAVKVVATVFP